MRTSESRRYRMGKRAQDVDRTRRRIIEATVRLHTSVGPANTTISSVAVQAGVTRLTVYRHFADDEQLFAACSRHWLEAHPPPAPEGWRRIADPGERAGRALTELYGWYRRNADDLLPIRRDSGAMPAAARAARQAADAALADALVAGLPSRGRARRRLHAAAAHVISFWTWRSLTLDHGLTDDEAVRLATGFLTAALDATTPSESRQDVRRRSVVS